MFEGTVKYFNEAKGWGWIGREGADDLFVHRSYVQGHGYRNLFKDEPVEFDVRPSDREGRELEAFDVHPPASRASGVVEEFDKGVGMIRPDTSDSPSDFVFFHHSDILKNGNARTTALEGEFVEYDEGRRRNGAPQAFRIKRLDSRLPLYRFADMGEDRSWLSKLAEKAEPEPWRYEHASNEPCGLPVLRSYLSYTFARIEQEDQFQSDPLARKIQKGTCDNRQYACFNTGLVTVNQEPLFALFLGKSPDKDGRDWRLLGFYQESDRVLLGAGFHDFPEMAHYFDAPHHLIYDSSKRLVIDKDHVLERLSRFPEDYHNDPGRAARDLDTARDRAVERVKRNFKTAIPCYYQKSIQLLLPLCLQDPTKADLALPVTRIGSGENWSYLGSTVLTLDMAYNNARLITKPASEWLKP